MSFTIKLNTAIYGMAILLVIMLEVIQILMLVFFIGVGWGWVFLSHCNEVDHDHFTVSAKQYITVIFPINLANIHPIIDTLQDSIETVVMERKHILQEPVIIYPIK